MTIKARGSDNYGPPCLMQCTINDYVGLFVSYPVQMGQYICSCFSFLKHQL